ncbi:hypothetical protein, partial [Mesorhizobium sp.]|uniref:hypothetical protein n=1 Tax=Mesorhizobium sp. TaxID=1871066 RepID=UPI0025E070A4
MQKPPRVQTILVAATRLATALKDVARYVTRRAPERKPETKKGGPKTALPCRTGNSRIDYSLMVTTMPAPTVRPPSRMA